MIEMKPHGSSNSKSFKDMTLEELWILFPIVLTPHQPQWADRAQEEIEALSEIQFSQIIVRSHGR